MSLGVVAGVHKADHYTSLYPVLLHSHRSWSRVRCPCHTNCAFTDTPRRMHRIRLRMCICTVYTYVAMYVNTPCTHTYTAVYVYLYHIHIHIRRYVCIFIIHIYIHLNTVPWYISSSTLDTNVYHILRLNFAKQAQRYARKWLEWTRFPYVIGVVGCYCSCLGIILKLKDT